MNLGIFGWCSTSIGLFCFQVNLEHQPFFMKLKVSAVQYTSKQKSVAKKGMCADANGNFNNILSVDCLEAQRLQSCGKVI